MTKANVTGFSNIVIKANTLFDGEMVFDVPVKDDGTYYQYSIGLPPQYVKDNIDVVAYSTIQKDGQTVQVWGPTYSRSVLTYVNSQINNSAIASDSASAKYKALRTMLVDMLNYGAAAQVKANYDTANLANAGLTETQKSWASADIASWNTVKSYNAETIENPTARFAAGALKLDDAVVPKMTFALKDGVVDINDITMKVTVGGQTFTYNAIDNPENFENYKQNVNGALGVENRYFFYFDDILANQMFDTIRFQIFVNGVAVSSVCTYSVESYVYDAYNISSDADKVLLRSMMKYGKAATIYGQL